MNGRVAILCFDKIPKFVTWEIPDMDALHTEERLLVEGFGQRGLDASLVNWSDMDVEWNTYDIALVRSTWDYIDRREEFLDVLSRIETSSCKLYNPFAAIAWNSDKHYLFDLVKWSIPIVPTYHVNKELLAEVQTMFLENNWQEAIFKPTVGGGASGIYKVNTHDIPTEGQNIFERHPEHIYLIQPLAESVQSEGEWSYVFFAGELAYVLLKKAAVGEYRIQSMYGGTLEMTEPTTQDRLEAKAIFDKLQVDRLYTRLDLVRFDGSLVIMEVELIEPILYFAFAPQGIPKMVEATLRQLQAR